MSFNFIFKLFQKLLVYIIIIITNSLKGDISIYKIELSLEVYEKMKQCLSEIHPEIILNLVSCDYQLASLGFVKSPPCVVEFDLTDEQMNNLLDELMELETDSVEMPKDSPEYQAYEKYGWMWSYLYYAESTTL